MPESNSDAKQESIQRLMLDEGLPFPFVGQFLGYYEQWRLGTTGVLREPDLRPAEDLPASDSLEKEFEEIGRRSQPGTVTIKLNGGLGTSMGLEGPKSLLPVKEGRTFLELIVRQSRAAETPLLLMNSFATDSDTREALDKLDASDGIEATSFLQHKQPKIDKSTFGPVSWPRDKDLEWCPPGHGDLFLSLYLTGLLESLLEQGYERAFVSNSDNLGATFDAGVCGYMVARRAPFLMEVTRRTEMDKKGGHLARNENGHFVLRESAQCAEEDKEAFEDIDRHRYFNTNNLWIDLFALEDLLVKNQSRLDLPLICNDKTVDPRDPSSPPVVQLETAMGSLISLLHGAQAIEVPRTRFAPVKKTNDLLAVRSDAYVLGGEGEVRQARGSMETPVEVDLDPRYFGLIEDLDLRFPEGSPSLKSCQRLEIEGDVRFGRDVSCEGRVRVVNRSDRPATIEDGAVLRGETIFPEA